MAPARKPLAALLALAAVLTAAPVMAQPYQPAIQGFNVDEVRRLAPGVELPFTLYGTPGGIATLHIAGANRNLTLVETEPGTYEGTYTIGSRDHLTPRSAVTANLRVGNMVATSVLSESLLRGVGYHPTEVGVAATGTPHIAAFDVDARDDLSAGNDLVFTVKGTPGARVEMKIEGARGTFLLPEVSPGTYRGAYTIRNRDRIRERSDVTAQMHYGDRVIAARLDKPLMAAATENAPRVARYCSNCATVEAVNVVNVSGNASYLGTLGGALAGGLLGSQVGGGSGRTAAEVGGAVAGAAIGRNIEANRGTSTHYEVVVRYNNGAHQTMTFANDPGYHVGDKVRVREGALTLDR